MPLDRAPLLVEGEILVVRSGAYTGDSAIVTKEWVGSAPGYDLRAKCGARADPRFVAYSLLSPAALAEIKLMSNRSAQPHLNADELGSIGIGDLPIDQQAERADRLDIQRKRRDALVGEVESQIGSLRELRQALITTAVTEGVEACEAVES